VGGVRELDYDHSELMNTNVDLPLSAFGYTYSSI
jgi:hypothetical protein